MGKFNFLENLLRREFAMSGTRGLRVDAVNPDSQPTVNRQSRLTSQQRHNSVSGAKVAREWLKYAAMFVMLLTLSIGNAWGETITFSQSTTGITTTSYPSGTKTKTISNVEFSWINIIKSGSNLQLKASTGEVWNSTVVPGKITNVSTTNSGTSRKSTLYWGTTAKPTTNSSSINGTSSTDSPANSCFGYIHIKRGSNAQIWTQMVITYTPATVTLGKSSVSGLDYTVGSGPSAAGSFTVSGTNLPDTLIVKAPSNFEVSTDGGSSWGSEKRIGVILTESASAGTLSSATVKVRLASGKSAGTYDGNVSVEIEGCKSVSGVTPKTVAVSGTVSAGASWKLKGSFDSWGDGYDMTGSGTVSVTRTLTANTRYEFKFVTGSDYYGNNGAIVHSVSDWTFATDKGDCVLYTGPAGDYTFSINTSTKEASITYPTVDHPNANYVYIKKGDGWSDARIYNWDSGSSDKMSDWAGSPVLATCEICGTTYYYGAAYFNKIIFRDGGSNQSNEVSLDRGKWLDETTHASSWSTFATYTISFGGNGNTGGSMSDITGIACGTNQALTANAFTKTGYDFDGWKADVDVKISGSTVSAGTKFNGGVTLQDIRSDIELTAQWTPTSYSITYNNLEGATNSNPTSYTIESSDITLVDPGTRGGYTFAGWYTNEGKTTPAGTPAIATGSTGNKTFWAKWTTLTDTYKTALHTDSTGWTSYASGVTKSGTGYTIPTPSSVKKGATSSCEDTHYHFAGWVADDYKGSPSGHIIPASGTTDATGTTYWAVWEKEAAGGGSLTKLTSSYEPAEGDNLVIVAHGTSYALYQETISSSYVNKWSFENNVATVGSDDKNYITLESDGNGDWYLGDETNGYIYTSGSNNLEVNKSGSKTAFTFGTEVVDAVTYFTFTSGRWLSYRSDLGTPNYRLGGSNAKASGANGNALFDLYKYVGVSFEDPKVVCEACAADPVMTSAASALKGDFSLTSVGVTATGWNPGTNCSWDEKGFVWGSSANPTVSNNKVIVATGTDATWDGALVPSNSTTPKTLAVGTTYHFRAYGKNGNDAADYVYSADVSFTPRSVTCGSVTGGTISAGTEVSAAGKTITLTATPANSHFTFNSWTIKKTSDNSDVTSSVSLSGQTSSATFTMPDYNVTITASFDEDAYATVNFYNAKNGNTPVSSIHVYEDEKPTPPTLTDGTSGDACDATSDKHYGWSTAKWNNTYATAELMNAAQTVYTKGSNLPAIAAGDLGTTIDYYAVWAQGTGSGSAAYKKVSSALDDYRGTYLIVFETDAICFDGSLTTLDAAGNYKSVTIVTSGTPYYIASTSTIDTYSFTISEGSTSGKYYIQSASEYYIGSTNADDTKDGVNELLSSTSTQYDHTISVTSGDATITGVNNILKCFKQAGQSDRFRYYKSTAGNVNMPQLYKYDPGITYSNFLTTCCEDPELEFGQTRYAVLRKDLHGDPGAEFSTIEITYSSVSDGEITVVDDGSDARKNAWHFTGASTWGTTATTGGTAASTTNHAKFVITDAANKKATFYVKSSTDNNGQGTYRIGLHQAATATYCETTVWTWVDVTLQDKFVDEVNGNADQTVDGHGPGGAAVTTPAESTRDAAKDDDCHETTRRLVGWVKETDMDSWYGTGQDRTLDLDDKTANITAPGATITTSGATWYAVWGEEVVTP